MPYAQYDTGRYDIDTYAPAGVVTPSPGLHLLTGEGTFALDTSAAWLAVTITSRPSRITSGAANPPNWYHVGMLSWGTSNGVMTAHPITRDQELIPLPGGMTQIWFALVGGVEVTVLELAAP